MCHYSSLTLLGFSSALFPIILPPPPLNRFFSNSPPPIMTRIKGPVMPGFGANHRAHLNVQHTSFSLYTNILLPCQDVCLIVFLEIWRERAAVCADRWMYRLRAERLLLLRALSVDDVFNDHEKEGKGTTQHDLRIHADNALPRDVIERAEFEEDNHSQ